MKAVFNAGPLINLAKLGILYVLPQVYTLVSVPSAVYNEVVVRGKEQNHPDAYVVELAVARNELVLLPSANVELSDAIRVLPIGQGEKQAIQLALNIKYDTVLLDDLLAREAVQRLGLRIKGTLGVIATAYCQQHLTRAELDIVFEALLARQDIWMSNALAHHELVRTSPESSDFLPYLTCSARS